MEDFSNETIDVSKLPRYEKVQFSRPNSNYRFVIGINFVLFFIVLVVAPFVFLYFNPIEVTQTLTLVIFVTVFCILTFSLLLTIANYKKKGFAFRNHDVLYRSGTIATNTIIIPYNRVQHVALHEGLFSRIFNLVRIEIFTAGGDSSDISIPGIGKEEADNIKQLLMGKIQKQL